MMMIHCKNGVQVDCTLLGCLGEHYLLGYAQDRLVVIKPIVANGDVTWHEVDSMDVLPFISKYL